MLLSLLLGDICTSVSRIRDGFATYKLDFFLVGIALSSLADILGAIRHFSM